MPTAKDALLLTINMKRQTLSRLSGRKRLAAALSLLELTKQHSTQAVSDLIKEHLVIAEETPCEEAAILFGEKAFLAFQQGALPETERYANKALRVARTCGSKRGETKALTLKAYLEDVRGQHKKVAALYTKALQTASRLERPGLIMDLATSLSKDGDYARSIELMQDALSQSKTLMTDPKLPKTERARQTRIYVEAWSRLGTVNESIGDYDAAEGAYENALSSSKKYGFVWEQYKALSRKFKLMLFRGNLQEAEQCLRTAEQLPLSGLDARAPLFLAHDRARFYRAVGRYDEALQKYRQVLWGNGETDERARGRHLFHVMQDQVDLFQETLAGIPECVIATGRARLAERLSEVARAYDDAVSGAGIYREADKRAGIAKQWKRLTPLVAEVFDQAADVVRYRHLVVRMITGKRNAIVEGVGRPFTLTYRAFLILKLLVERKGCVTRQEMERYWSQHGEHAGGSSGEQTGVRVYLKRDLRGKLQLGDYLEECPKGMGWKLAF